MGAAKKIHPIYLSVGDFLVVLVVAICLLRYDAGIRPDYDGPPTEVEVNLAIRSVK